MNHATPTMVPKDLGIHVTTVVENASDPLNLTFAENWELDTLTGILTNRITTLVSNIQIDILDIENHRKTVEKSLKSVSSLGITIRNLLQWPIANGSAFRFKYDDTLYKVEAIEPRKFEEIERAKNFVSKNSLRATQTGL